MKTLRLLLPLLLLLPAAPPAGAAGGSAPPDFNTAVLPIFLRHCTGCHNTEEREGDLVLETHGALLEGGESGVPILPGKSGESLLVQLLERTKEPFMPPGKRKPLSSAEVAAIRAWIDGGAKPPSAPPPDPVLAAVPALLPAVPPRIAVNSLAWIPRLDLLAAGRYREVELRSVKDRGIVRRLTGHHGNVTALAASADGSRLASAAGEPGQYGEAHLWETATGALLQTFRGHRDSLYAIALSPDAKVLATAGYDQGIIFWSVETGTETRAVKGHEGAVLDLAFRAGGAVLASASADRTLKLWDAASGNRLDTFSQSTKELAALAFSPDGSRLVAGGADNRIRAWHVSASAAEGSSQLVESIFAHERAILRLVYSRAGRSLASSAEDGTVKLWDADTLKERILLERQPDWPVALTFAGEKDEMLVVGRLDGSMGVYDSSSGKPIPPARPVLARAAPRGLERGVTARVKLTGSHLSTVSSVAFSHPGLAGKVLAGMGESSEAVWIEATPAADLEPGRYEVSVTAAGGPSGKVPLFVDDLPQFVEAEPGPTGTDGSIIPLPASIWGVLDLPGDVDSFTCEARAGETIVIDVGAMRFGSKANLVLTLLDAHGRVLETRNDFDGDPDPILARAFGESARFVVQVMDQVRGASEEHFYRLSIGAFPFVTGFYPLSVPANAESEVELVGYNLPAGAMAAIKASGPGDVPVPIDSRRYRSRRPFTVAAGAAAELREVEPNDGPASATPISAPSAVAGRIASRAADEMPDVDVFLLEARAGETWILETEAARRGSPLDSRIEVLHADGTPVRRLFLQAVRDCQITFRGIDSTGNGWRLTNWEEMELNQYLYVEGEVSKIFRMPQGPDSDFLFYTSETGPRRAYFETTPTSHPLETTCYVVVPHPPGTKLIPSGLPVFPVDYVNDDGDRRIGKDSRVTFTAPAAGKYLVRVTDVGGAGGDRFAYRLVVREPRPDFQVRLEGQNPGVGAGSGREFSVIVDRMDGFEDEVSVEVTGIPPGFTVSTPLVIEAGHREAKGTLHAAEDAPPPPEASAEVLRATATAVIRGEKVTKPAGGLGKVTLGAKPQLIVHLEPREGPIAPLPPGGSAAPAEITIAPGQSVTAWIKIERNSHQDLVTFNVDNLPHGVIVDNIGLNGVLIPKGENERQIFLSAERWVPETSRLCHAVSNEAGRQTSRPVLLHVRKPGAVAAGGGKPD
ncbi:MAG TPA: c-type cytochrome domain-containing protein [Planctomycetota bacterium]|nr:c-type cytochrome domain-containing protein [Planctomycetota bacterium]